MNKKILFVAIILLVAGAVVAVLVSRSPDADPEGDAPGAGDTSPGALARGAGSSPGSSSARSAGRQPPATPGGRRPTAKNPNTPTLTEDQKDRIVLLCRQAGAAYVAGKHQQAQVLANKALDMDPTNEIALQIAGASACALKMQSNAQAAYNRLPPTSPKRRMLVRVCTRNGVTLAAAPTTSGTAPAPAAPTSPGAGAAAAGDKPEGVPKKLSSTAVTATIRKVRKEIEQCTKKNKGLVRIRLTVDSSGKVNSAAIMGEQAKSPTGACIKEVILKMTFPPFSGPPRTFIFPIITH